MSDGARRLVADLAGGARTERAAAVSVPWWRPLRRWWLRRRARSSARALAALGVGPEREETRR